MCTQSTDRETRRIQTVVNSAFAPGWTSGTACDWRDPLDDPLLDSTLSQAVTSFSDQNKERRTAVFMMHRVYRGQSALYCTLLSICIAVLRSLYIICGVCILCAYSGCRTEYVPSAPPYSLTPPSSYRKNPTTPKAVFQLRRA